MRCDYRNTTLEERIAMVKSYKNILLLHSNDAMQMSKVLLEMERTAFLDGYYFAFALRCCNLCADCGAKRGDPCPTPEKLRPCEELFGIDVYKTARQLGLTIQVLRSKKDIQNRYGFLLID